MTTGMQPLHCNQGFNKRIEPRTHEQPLVAEHRGPWRNRLRVATNAPATASQEAAAICTEKRKVSCSGFLPNTSPVQHSCSHYNPFGNSTWLPRMDLLTWQQNMTTIMKPLHCDLQPEIAPAHIELRTHEQPLVADHRGGTDNASQRAHPQPPRTRAALHRRLQPLYTKKRKVSCSGFLPNTSPMQHFAAIIHYVSAILVLCDVLLCDDCDAWLCDVLLCDVLLCDVLLCNVSW